MHNNSIDEQRENDSNVMGTCYKKVKSNDSSSYALSKDADEYGDDSRIGANLFDVKLILLFSSFFWISNDFHVFIYLSQISETGQRSRVLRSDPDKKVGRPLLSIQKDSPLIRFSWETKYKKRFLAKMVKFTPFIDDF